MVSQSAEQQQGNSLASNSFSKATPFVSADAQEAAAAGSKGASPADAAPVLSADMRSASMRQAPAQQQQDKMFLRPSFTSVESLDTIKTEEVVEVRAAYEGGGGYAADEVVVCAAYGGGGCVQPMRRW